MPSARLFLSLLFFSVFLSCQKTDIPTGYTEYIIPQGGHYTLGNGYKTVTGNIMRFAALFDSTCKYTVTDPKNQTDINKLYGFSDCGKAHHISSARVGWVWNGQAVELYAYCYADSLRSSKLLGTIALNAPVELSIEAAAGEYIFTMNGINTTMKRSCTGSGITGYQLYPYFGGDEVAPQDVHIYIKDL